MIDLVQGDVLEVLRQVPDNTFHAVLTDPPYGLSFMGKHWDYDVPSVEVWREVTRVLRPGGAVLSFGGTRTYHRLVCNAEDGGLEVRDQLCWLYAKGFPKSLNVSKALDKAAGAERPVIGFDASRERPNRLYASGAIGNVGGNGKASDRTDNGATRTAAATDLAKTWDGYGTALKPAHEPILLARKPLDGTVAENVTRWGCGALDIDGCRIGEHDLTPEQFAAKAKTRTAPNTYGEHAGGGSSIQAGQGRWPANLLLDEGAAEVLDETVGPRKSSSRRRLAGHRPFQRNGGGQKIWGAKNTNGARPDVGYSDSGGPSRFFFSSKVSTRERNEGCDSLPLRWVSSSRSGLDSPRAGAGRQGGARNHHPTLKPIALARYLAQLIRPPGEGALILIPFAGAGSEVIGATLAGWAGGLAIERDADYVQIARARIAYHLREV